MTDDELVKRLRQYFGDHTMGELELIDVVRACRLVPPVAGWWRPTPPAAMVPTRSRRVLARWGR